MHAAPMPIADLMVIEPRVFEDDRGSFYESFNATRFEQITGVQANFVQDNHSFSNRNVLRGLHYQIQYPQGKLVRVTTGCALDVAVDLRRHSPTFGHWASVVLSAENRRQHWIPPGFAHGFAVLGECAELLYKTTDYWYPEHERCLLWNDPAIGIDWQLRAPPILSQNDQAGILLADIEAFP